jgi:hypothetical protein
MHAGYFLGSVILVIYLAGAVIDKLLYRFISKDLSDYPQDSSSILYLGGALLACLVVTVINPNGLKIIAYPFQTLTSPSMQQFIQEWYSPDFHKIEWLPFLVFVLILILTGIFKRKNWSTAHLLLSVLLGFSALHSMRNIPLFVITVAPILTDQVSSFIHIPVYEFKPGKSSFFIFPLVILLFLLGIGMRFYQTIKDQPFEEEMVFPKQAVDWIAINRPAGVLFNPYDWGGYLIWRLFPNYKVFIDGRADVYGDKFLSEYSKIYLNGDKWEDIFDKYNIELVLIDKSSILVEEINENPDWKVLFMDNKSVLFGLNSP